MIPRDAAMSYDVDIDDATLFCALMADAAAIRCRHLATMPPRYYAHELRHYFRVLPPLMPPAIRDFHAMLHDYFADACYATISAAGATRHATLIFDDAAARYAAATMSFRYATTSRCR